MKCAINGGFEDVEKYIDFYSETWSDTIQET